MKSSRKFDKEEELHSFLARMRISSNNAKIQIHFKNQKSKILLIKISNLIFKK